MRRVILTSLLACASLCAALPSAAHDADAMVTTANNQSRLKGGMRAVWADHVFWTRQYIIAAVAETPDAPAAEARLVRNQKDIGEAFVPYYGSASGTKLTALLQEHIVLAAGVVAAAKSGSPEKLKAADELWHGNARELASFLSGANPYWEKTAMTKMLDEHLEATTQVALARLRKDWAGDVAAFDKVLEMSMMMADELTAGISRQFPAKF